MSVTIYRDEWLKALSDADLYHDSDESAVTVGEFMVLLSCNRATAERKLLALAKAGRATRTHKRVQIPDRGRQITMVAYKLVDTPKKKR